MSDPSLAAGQRAFRDALGAFATGVAIVTTRAGAAGYGITVNSFASVSLEPPLVLWCAQKGTERYATFRDAPRFAVSVLARAQEDLAVRFASRAEIDAGEPAFEASPSGALLVRGALARFDCAREAVHDAGDHAIVVGRVLWFDGPREGEGLLFRRGVYEPAD